MKLQALCPQIKKTFVFIHIKTTHTPPPPTVVVTMSITVWQGWNSSLLNLKLHLKKKRIQILYCIHIIIAKLLKSERLFSVFTYQNLDILLAGSLIRRPPPLAERSITSQSRDTVYRLAITWSPSENLTFLQYESYANRPTQIPTAVGTVQVFRINKYNIRISVMFSNAPLHASDAMRQTV